MTELRRLDNALDELFPRRYRAVEFGFVTDHNGDVHYQYRCYVEGYPYGRGITVEAAIVDMMKDGEGPK